MSVYEYAYVCMHVCMFTCVYWSGSMVCQAPLSSTINTKSLAHSLPQALTPSTSLPHHVTLSSLLFEETTIFLSANTSCLAARNFCRLFNISPCHLTSVPALSSLLPPRFHLSFLPFLSLPLHVSVSLFLSLSPHSRDYTGKLRMREELRERERERKRERERERGRKLGS